MIVVELHCSVCGELTGIALEISPSEADYARLVGRRPLPPWFVQAPDHESLEQPSPLAPIHSELTYGTTAPPIPVENRAGLA